jgi:hypothetical protein
MSLQRNSALSMRTICFSKPVSELPLQTGLTRPRSWTEEVSDLGRDLFSFETSASRERQWRPKGQGLDHIQVLHHLVRNSDSKWKAA